MTEDNTEKAIVALLKQLPVGYPEAKLSKADTGFTLEIGHTIIFEGASATNALNQTRNYVHVARKKGPRQ